MQIVTFADVSGERHPSRYRIRIKHLIFQ